MSESSDQKLCPSCGNVIPPEAPQGLCPRCVLRGVAASEMAESAAATRTAAAPAMQPPTLEEIRHAFPQFEVIEFIGSGGMGAVYKVRQPKLDRIVALKVLPKSLADDVRFTERFLREAQALAKLNHPNIVAVHDFGESSNGDLNYLLMEFVEGANLRQAMRAGRFTPEQAFAVVPEICAALQYAHDEGVLHRDIKPENLLLDTKGRVKIVDFGIAKLLGEKPGIPLTGTYAPGTPQYMAPEQIEHPADVDHRADIYSLGVVFYEMLTGELPIGRFAAPSEKARVGGEVDDIVFRALDKEPDRRQQSAGEVKTQVESIDDTPPPPLSAAQSFDADRFGHQPAGRSATSRGAGRALMLLIVSLVVFGLTWASALFVAWQMRSVDLKEQATVQMQVAELEVEIAELNHVAAAVRAEGGSREQVEALAKQVNDGRQNIADLRKRERGIRSRGPSKMGAIVSIVVSIAVGIGCAVLALIATVSGWKTLRALRCSGERRGRVSAAIAALFLPVLLLSALIFVILVLPARGNWAGPAISLAVIGILVVNGWWFMRLWRWLNTSPGEEELALWRRHNADAAATDGSKKSGRGWLLGSLALLLLVPVLFIGGCVAYLMASRDVNAEAAHRNAAEGKETLAKIAQAQALAEAEQVGDDLSTQERMIVGSWSFERGPEAGMVDFHAARTWRLKVPKQSVTMSGTWRIVDGILEQTVTVTSEGEGRGTVIQSEILELIDNEKLKIRDLNGGDLELRPIHQMSDIEISLLGGWKLDGHR